MITSTSRTPVTIYIAPQHVLQRLYEQALTYNVPDLRLMLRYTFLPFKINGYPAFEYTSGRRSVDPDWIRVIEDNYAACVGSRSSCDKNTIAVCMAAFLSDRRNIDAMVSRLAPAERRLWRNAAIGEPVSQADLINAKNLPKSTPADFFSDNVAFSWLAITRESAGTLRWYYRRNDLSMTFALEGWKRLWLLPSLLPDAVEIQYIDRSDIDPALTLFNGEQESFMIWEQYPELLITGAFGTSVYPRPLLNTVRCITAATGITPFPGVMPDTVRASLMITGMLASREATENCAVSRKSDTVSTDTIAIIRKALEHIAGNMCDKLTIGRLLPNVRCGKSHLPLEQAIYSLIRGACDMIFSTPCHDGWVDMKSFASVFDIRWWPELRALLSGNALYRAEISRTYHGRSHAIDTGSVRQHLVTPALRGMIFMMAAMGLAEIAYEPSDTEDPFEGLRFWRLTTLGKAVSGWTESYTPVSHYVRRPHYTLDSSRLIIVADGRSDPMASKIRDFADPISVNRYKVTPESFCRKCTDTRQLIQRIDLFLYLTGYEQLKTIDAYKEIRQRSHTPTGHPTASDTEPAPYEALPAVWRELIDTVILRTTAIAPDPVSYHVFTIDAGAEDLQRLITSDPAISTLCIRAEGFRVLVSPSNLHEFIKQLSRHGYLFDIN